MKHLKIWQKMAVGFGIVIILIAIGGVVAVKTASRLSGMTEKLYRHPYAVGISIRDIQTQLVAVHRSMKDVAMSGDLQQLESYQAKVDELANEAVKYFAVLDERFLGDKTEISKAEKLFRDWEPIRRKVIEQRKIQILNDANGVTRAEGAPHVAKIMKSLDTLIEFANEKAAEFASKARTIDEGTDAGQLVEKFHRHPYTVATKAIEIKMEALSILKDMKDLSVAKKPSDVNNLAMRVEQQEKETLKNFGILKERFLGDKARIDEARKLFVDWKPIRDKVITMRLNQVHANPGEITRKEGAPHLAELISILDKIQKFADDKAVTFNENAQREATSSNRILIFVFLIAGIVGVIAALTITRAIVGPLRGVVDNLTELAQGEGDLTARLAVNSRDEIGQMAQRFNEFMEKLHEMISFIGKGVETLSSTSTELTSISQQMSANADQTLGKCNTVAAAAEEMSANMNSVSAAMEQSTTNTNMVSAASEEMTATINEIAQSAENSRAISEQAVSQTLDTGKQMSELSEAAQAIGKVTETITEISEQTNLLALNATIEAARAGEAGKGFAVVANEIKELAKQTAEATLNIKRQIDGIQNSTEITVERIDEIGKVISSVNEAISTIATAVEEQSTSTREIADNISQVASGTGEVNENVAQSSQVASEITMSIAEVNQTSEEMVGNSKQVSESAHELSGLAKQLNEMVGRFKF